MKNIDGIKKIKKTSEKALASRRRKSMSDVALKIATTSLSKKTLVKQQNLVVTDRKRTPTFTKNKFPIFYSQKPLPVAALTLLLILVFISGMWTALNTTHSQADQQQILGQSTDNPDSTNIPLDGLTTDASTTINNDILFNTPIQQLKDYLANTAEPDIIERRKNQLSAFLQQMHSPLAAAAETISEQPHWQFIVAIAFAESTLGKNCTDKNCSNIGVGPSSPYWHKYVSYQDWVVDFNRLLDKKYNNWTLQQMCGVYVKPCSSNWLTATQEILDQLKIAGIQ